MSSRTIVAFKHTSPQTILSDYQSVMDLGGARRALSRDLQTLLKLNLSWTLYFPACSSQPWQVEGVVGALRAWGYDPLKLTAIENKTVVTDPWKGAHNNLWLPVLDRYQIRYQPLTEVEWTVHQFERPLLRLHKIFPEGIEIPKIYAGKQIVHFPTVKTHGHSVTTGAIKNAFGGLLKEVRHYAHKHIHEVLVDLVIMQQELHPAVFAVMDGTVCGDGAGPRTMIPREGNLLLASSDSVAIDAVAARIMGFEPLEIPYLRMCHDMGLGCADLREIEVVGDDWEQVRFQFESKRSLVIWGDQMLRRGPLRFLERVALHSPLVVWAPFASNVYHDWFWYPIVGKTRIRRFADTPWGELYARYRKHGPLSGPALNAHHDKVPQPGH
jgi:uncharacterized protein (DUF362 family)